MQGNYTAVPVGCIEVCTQDKTAIESSTLPVKLFLQNLRSMSWSFSTRLCWTFSIFWLSSSFWCIIAFYSNMFFHFFLFFLLKTFSSPQCVFSEYSSSPSFFRFFIWNVLKSLHRVFWIGLYSNPVPGHNIAYSVFILHMSENLVDNLLLSIATSRQQDLPGCLLLYAFCAQFVVLLSAFLPCLRCFVITSIFQAYKVNRHCVLTSVLINDDGIFSYFQHFLHHVFVCRYWRDFPSLSDSVQAVLGSQEFRCLWKTSVFIRQFCHSLTFIVLVLLLVIG